MRIGKMGVIAVLICGLIAVASVANAAGSHHLSTTKLTIAVWPHGVFGYVSSPDAGCARARKIVVFSERRRGAHATRLKREAAIRDQVGYEWMARTPRGRSFYVVASATRGCAAARSKTVSVSSAAEPGCPSDGQKCQIDISWQEKHAGAGHCYSWAKDTEYGCDGETTSATMGWHADADLSWAPSGDRRRVDFSAYYNEPQKILKGTIVGYASATDHSSPNFDVTDAYTNDGNNHTHYRTCNKPGVQAGADGGPLYIDFDAPTPLFGRTKVHIWGILYRNC